MKKTISLLVFILALTLINCRREEYKTITINEFQESENLAGKPIEKISLLTRGNVNLICIDSFLVVQKSEEPIIQIYNNKTFELLAEFGKKGRGPNEFISPELLNQTSFDSTNGSPVVCLYDKNRRRFVKVNILCAVNNMPNRIYTEVPIPKHDQIFTYFFYRDDDLLIATPETESRFIIYKDSSESFKTVPFLPKPNFKIPELLLDFVYRSTSFIDKDRGLMVSAPIFMGEIDFFDLDGNYLSSSIFFPREGLKKDLTSYGVNGSGFDPKYHIFQLHANKKFIIALNYNNYQSAFLNNDSSTLSNQNIMVFDWQGNPVKKFVLDNSYFIKSFAVDWGKNRFYGYCSNENEHTIIMYEFDKRLTD
ncbi:MAG: hypothetical protein GX947_08465 [Tissierellia bacterium]|nr:hypothetical protein [Tissierellia bacterium]